MATLVGKLFLLTLRYSLFIVWKSTVYCCYSFVTEYIVSCMSYCLLYCCCVDLTNTSRPDRLREIADRFNLDHSAMLDNVLYARAYTSE